MIRDTQPWLWGLFQWSLISALFMLLAAVFLAPAPGLVRSFFLLAVPGSWLLVLAIFVYTGLAFGVVAYRIGRFEGEAVRSQSPAFFWFAFIFYFMFFGGIVAALSKVSHGIWLADRV